MVRFQQLIWSLPFTIALNRTPDYVDDVLHAKIKNLVYVRSRKSKIASLTT